MRETTAVAHGGNPLWRRCLPKTALHRFQKNKFTAIRDKSESRLL
ncbi:hypothetical protein [Moorena sp. SIO4G3]|nr:hypothetical protein [Moorena sp. SIO4G3]